MAPNAENTELSLLMLTNITYSFIVAALGVLLPLYLLDKKIDVTAIGMILSLAPLVFLVLRILLASAADGTGTRAINITCAISNIAAIVIYLIATSPVGFAAGAFAEGMRNSGFWATSRTDIIIAKGRQNAAHLLAYFSGFRQLAGALGMIAVGFMLAWLSFQTSLLLLLLLSTVLLFLVGCMRNGYTMLRLGPDTIRRIFAGRTPLFWQSSIALAQYYTAANVLVAFLLPLYLYDALGMDYLGVSSILAIFSLAIALAMLLVVRCRLSPAALLFLSLFTVPSLLLLPHFSGGSAFLVLVAVLAISSSSINIISEYILATVTAGSPNLSTDMGVLFAPLRLGEFALLAASGFIIVNWGYAMLFYICALLSFLFILFCAAHKQMYANA